MKTLHNSVAVVTGAGYGVGRAIAIGLAREGCDVVLAARNQRKLEETQWRVEQAGRRGIVSSTDLTRYDDIQILAQTVKREFGKLDILVNCAFGHIGEDEGKSLLEVMPEEIIEFNGIITGIQLLTRELAPLLQASGGRSVYIVADWGRPQHNVFTGTPPSATTKIGSSVFSSGKWALEGFAGSLERELGIPATAINPGIIASVKPSSLDQEEPEYFDIDDPIEAIESEESYSGGWAIPLSDIVASTILALKLHSVVKTTDLKPFTPDYDGLHV